jgi:hypothetical protein
MDKRYHKNEVILIYEQRSIKKETRYLADNPLIVSDYEAEECIKISEEIYKHVMSKLKR